MLRTKMDCVEVVAADALDLCSRLDVFQKELVKMKYTLTLAIIVFCTFDKQSLNCLQLAFK
jgi:hypothetical protein